MTLPESLDELIAEQQRTRYDEVSPAVVIALARVAKAADWLYRDGVPQQRSNQTDAERTVSDALRSLAAALGSDYD